MIAAAFDDGVPARWVTGDEVYGADPGLRVLTWNSAGSATSWRSAATDAYASTTAAPSCAATRSPSGSPPPRVATAQLRARRERPPRLPVGLGHHRHPAR